MPCATIHLWLAQKALTDWEATRATPPFPIGPDTRDAFLHGSLGPDWGFVPGGVRLHSVLAHYVDPAPLALQLLLRAQTDVERAFAWGWVAHMLADVALHPEVGRAAGERLRGDRKVRLNALDDVVTHVGLEVGWDIVTFRAYPEIPRPCTDALFDRAGITFVQGAYAETYGVTLSGDALLRSHILATRRTARWPLALDTLDKAHRMSGRTSRSARMLHGALLPFAPSESAFRGFLTPIRPPDWLLARASAYREGFSSALARVQMNPVSGLENRNLESGEPAGPHDPHPESVAAYRRLQQLRIGP